jgi:hypothetical protein
MEFRRLGFREAQLGQTPQEIDLGDSVTQRRFVMPPIPEHERTVIG